MRLEKIFLGTMALGLVAAVALGLVVFWWSFGEIGSFVSLAGIKSTLIWLGVVAVVALDASKSCTNRTRAIARPASALACD